MFFSPHLLFDTNLVIKGQENALIKTPKMIWKRDFLSEITSICHPVTLAVFAIVLSAASQILHGYPAFFSSVSAV